MDASTIYFDQEKLFKYAGLQKQISTRSVGGAQMLASGSAPQRERDSSFGRSSFIGRSAKSFKASMI